MSGSIPTFALPSVTMMMLFFPDPDFCRESILRRIPSPRFVPDVSGIAWSILSVVSVLTIALSPLRSLQGGAMRNVFPAKITSPIESRGLFFIRVLITSLAFSIRLGLISSDCIDFDISSVIMMLLLSGTAFLLVVVI